MIVQVPVPPDATSYFTIRDEIRTRPSTMSARPPANRNPCPEMALVLVPGTCFPGPGYAVEAHWFPHSGANPAWVPGEGFRSGCM